MVVVRIAYALASVAGLGILLGLGLAVASRLLAVRKDERVEAIENALPGSNCGACGFAGCAAYAAEIVGGEVALDLCTVGGADVAAQIAEIMEVECLKGRDTGTWRTSLIFDRYTQRIRDNDGSDEELRRYPGGYDG